MNAIAERALRGEGLAGTPVIDWHVHLGKWVTMHMPGQGEALIRHARRLGIAKLVVNGTKWPALRESNDAVAAFAARHPDMVIGFAVANPYQGGMADEVRRCIDELGFRGLKVHNFFETYHSPRGISSYTKEWDRVFAVLAERHLPVLYHGVVTEAMVRDWPDVPFVAAHGIAIVATMERMAAYPNFHVDTPASSNVAWCLKAGVDILGADRILWGTDAPLADFAQRLGVVLDSGLPDADIRKILGLNAARLLGLPLSQEGTTGG